MLAGKVFSREAELLKKNKILAAVLLCLCATIILQAFFLYKTASNVKVVIYPVGYNKKIVISKTEVDQEYLYYLSRSIFDLYLSYTPLSIKENYEALLSLMTPHAVAVYKPLFEKIIDEVSAGKLLSIFNAQNLQLDVKNHRVIVKGRRFILLEGSQTVVDSTSEVYAFEYKVNNFKFQIEKIGVLKDLRKEEADEAKKNEK